MKEGRRGEVGDRLEDPLARDVDLDLGADRAHRRRDSSRPRAPGGTTSRQILSDGATLSALGSIQAEAPGRRPPSSTASAPAQLDDRYETGSDPRRGHLSSASAAARSSRCGRPTSCPTARAAAAPSTAATRSSSRTQDHGADHANSRAPAPQQPPSWLDEARERAAEPGPLPRLRDDDGEIVLLPDRARLDQDRPQRHRRHPPRRPQRLPPPRPGRLRSPASRCASSTTAASTASSSTARWSSGAAARRRRAGDRPLRLFVARSLTVRADSGHPRP